MTTLPPDPAAAHEAELRSEDDGMPVHPAKSDDPAAYAETHEERERAAAAGYPAHPVARAVADANHLIASVVDELTAPRNRMVVTVAGLLGFGLAALLLQRSYQASLRRLASRGW
jgi:hypothetical protein